MIDTRFVQRIYTTASLRACAFCRRSNPGFKAWIASPFEAHNDTDECTSRFDYLLLSNSLK